MAIILLFIITSMALSVFIKIVKFGKKIQKRVVTSLLKVLLKVNVL